MSATPDQAWFLSVLDAHQRLIHKVCWAYAESPADRDDLFQEIVMRLWTAAARYDPDRKLTTWMYRVALNVAIDFHRRRHRRRLETHWPDGHAGEAARPEPAADEALAALRDAIERQSHADRALLLLHLDGNSHREIAEVLGISESNVGTRLSRIRRSLRQAVR